MKTMSETCCTAPGDKAENLGFESYHQAAIDVALASAPVQAELSAALIAIPGGFFDMGARQSRFPQDFDAPRRKVKLSAFRIAATSCTNAQYSDFVKATGYKTVAENEGWSYVFHLSLTDPKAWPQSPPNIPWWRRVDGAYWAAPEGPGSHVTGRGEHPVVHIAWYDAVAYCTWAGLRLATEAQWECAARGGLKHKKFPWGNEFTPNGGLAMNTWQGHFPNQNTRTDGKIGPVPATSYAPNGFGLFNTCGNVWEWVQDFYAPEPPTGPFPLRDPAGPNRGRARVQRGGSYLCHASYCDRYYVHSRTRNDPDSSTGNCGFRVAAFGV